MDHNCRVIGFLGVDKYDFILYLSRILYAMGKKILLVDYSENYALSCCIPHPEALRKDILEYRGIYYMNGAGSGENYSLINDTIEIHNQQYDYILVDYGFDFNSIGLNNCDAIICVTDQQLHNLRQFSLNNREDNIKGILTALIIRDVGDCKTKYRYLIDEMGLDQIAVTQTFITYQDDLDVRYRLNCQYDGVVRLHRLSKYMKAVLKGIVELIVPEVDRKTVNKAFIRAAKGG
ncbi:MAG TPA: hypothetical protein VJ888_09665 [Mobilitalea sp.]|nr:hypothetical protein [Mobilitalea sp.]